MVEESGKILNRFRDLLQSKYLALFSLLFGFLCWALGWVSTVVCVEAFIFILVLLFAKDVKNIYAPFFFISFFIPDIRKMTNYTVYYVAVGLALATLVGVFIYKCIRYKRTITSGNICVGLLASFLAFLLGGIFNNFVPINTLMIFGFCVGIFILYFLAVNFTENLDEYLVDLFLIGGFLVGIEILIYYLKAEDTSGFFSAQGINTGSLIIVLSIASAFIKALKSKRKYIYLILAIILTVLVVVSKCRAGMLLAFAVDVGFTVYLLIKVKKKLQLILALGVMALILLVLLLVSEAVRNALSEMLFGKEGVSGRDELWAKCLELFSASPIMGNGFYHVEKLPHIRDGSLVILSHNTVVQWLTCLGIVGTSIMGVYYFYKYRALFSGFNMDKLFAGVCVVALEISGMVDQAANMDVFIVSISIILIASIEKKGKPDLKREKQLKALPQE